MKPVLLIRVDANSKIGWGHFYRCLALAQMLKEHFSILFAIASPEKEAVNILHNEDFSWIELSEVPYNTTDSSIHEVPFDLREHLNNVDIVVLDGYAFGHIYQKDLKRFPVKVVVVEDNGGGAYFADLIINHAPGLRSENYEVPDEDAKFALGPDYALLRPLFLNAAKKKPLPKDKIETIFICFGGSDYYNLTHKTSLWFLENTAYKLKAVVGSSYERKTELKHLQVQFNYRFSVKQNLTDCEMLLEMQNADLGIVPSSGILYECIASRLPVISGYYVDNQYSIYNGWKTLNVFLDANNFLNTDWKEVVSLISKENLNTCINNGVASLDGMSDERIMKCFKNLLD